MLPVIAWITLVFNVIMGAVMLTGYKSLKMPAMKLALFIGMVAASGGVLCGLYLVVYGN